MKILLGRSRVAMKLLLKILLQCSLPVDGSSAGRGGSAQAARADGVGRAGAQRRARSPRGPRSHACHRSHGGQRGCAAASGKYPTHPWAARLRVGWGCGGEIRGVWGLFARRWNLSVGGSAPGGGAAGRDACTAEEGKPSPGSRANPTRSCPSFLLYLEYTTLSQKKKKGGKKGKTPTTSPGPRSHETRRGLGPWACSGVGLGSWWGRPGCNPAQGKVGTGIPPSAGRRGVCVCVYHSATFSPIYIMMF